MAADKLELRQANSKDAPQIVSWFPTRAQAVTWGGPQVSDPLTPDWLANEFQYGNYWVWAGPNDALAGVCGLANPEPGLIHLIRFGIAPEFRGQRLAKVFIDDILKLAGSLGATRATLNVYGSNDIARRLYLSAGFTAFGERIAEEDSSGISWKMSRIL